MSVVARARCAFGRHSGEWSWPDSQCTMVRACDYCGTVEEKTVHSWGAFEYVAPGRCDQRRRCERCGGTESRVWHQWGPWVYGNLEMNAPQERVCRRCGEAERTRYTLR